MDLRYRLALNSDLIAASDAIQRIDGREICGCAIGCGIARTEWQASA